MYEVECFVVGQQQRVPPGAGGRDLNGALETMLDHPEYWVYPMDYQLLRIIHLCMLLSGTVFEMLKIYNPEHAERSQTDYDVLDEEDKFEPEPEEIHDGGGKVKGKKGNRKGHKKGKRK